MQCVVALQLQVLAMMLISCFFQIHASSRFRCWGYSVPQTSVDPAVLWTTTNAVANACKLRGIVGYFSIDFVTFIDPNSVGAVFRKRVRAWKRTQTLLKINQTELNGFLLERALQN